MSSTSASTSAHPNDRTNRPSSASTTTTTTTIPHNPTTAHQHHRQTLLPPTSTTTSSSSTSLTASTIHRNRQYTHLHAQLAQLNAHVADLENLVGMTAVQAEYVRGLGGWWGGALMAGSRVLGEEGASANASGRGQGQQGGE